MEVYSHSKLSLYEMCPEAYKVKYIDRTFPELPSSIHAFLGSTVHSALENLYVELMGGKVLDLDEVIEYFAREWHDTYTLDIRVPAGENVENFFNKGVKFLIDYYRSNLPFSKLTVEVEKKLWFPITDGVYITGYIDRLEKHKDGSYEVHDYKTNGKMKEQKEVDADRQLAFYHLGLQDLFGEDVRVKLTWHFLAHNKKVHSSRTKEQLDVLKNQTLALIGKIRNTTEWPACGKPWCDWCAYKALHGVVNKSEGGGSRKVFTLNDSLSKWL
ncbi:MAG: PD-(D/E)XK nuclease family protein [Nanoarchaeota archaeon]|nr:PD-(D/E)XK nuclease family protein [Nanoarchaeota archaeon]MBU0977471.1 PD-(D/E)XK nuclease family protein [Nanoarchaeota archaeon]